MFRRTGIGTSTETEQACEIEERAVELGLCALAEVHLLLAWPGGELWAIEATRSMSPKAEGGFHVACEDLSPSRRLLVYPGEDRWPGANGVEVIGLDAIGRAAGVHP